MKTAVLDNLPETSSHHRLHCMEIWGGSKAADQSVSTPGLNTWVYSRPYEGAVSGGDVHYVSLCGGGMITRFILADICGHGASVVEEAYFLRKLMRSNINRKSQTKLIKALNRQFAYLAKTNRFATAIVATYLTTNNQLTISNAGHPRPLWYSVATGRWTVLNARSATSCGSIANIPLGIDNATRYDQTEIRLEKGDLVLFYTDALVEAMNPKGQALDYLGLLEMVRNVDVSDAHDVIPSLLDALKQFCEKNDVDDDLTIMLLEHTASKPQPLSIRESLDVYLKVMRFKKV
jgi:serine phosphatase RsbU (regulator of sigma subunit)